MSGKEGSSIEPPAGLALCQYCNIIETEAAPQRFLVWRTNGTSSQNPCSSPESAFNDNGCINEVRLHASSTVLAIEASLLRVRSVQNLESHMAAEIISTKVFHAGLRRNVRKEIPLSNRSGLKGKSWEDFTRPGITRSLSTFPNLSRQPLKASPSFPLW